MGRALLGGAPHFHIYVSSSFSPLISWCALSNLIAFTKDGSDPFIRLYLLPDKSRTGRRKTGTVKRTLNPVYDQTWVCTLASSARRFVDWGEGGFPSAAPFDLVCVCRFEFSVSMVELHRRTLDVAVKNGGGILSKHKGLLGKVTTASNCFF